MSVLDYQVRLDEVKMAIARGQLDVALRWGISLCTALESIAGDVERADTLGVLTDRDRTFIMNIASVMHETVESLRRFFPADSLEKVE